MMLSAVQRASVVLGRRRLPSTSLATPSCRFQSSSSVIRSSSLRSSSSTSSSLRIQSFSSPQETRRCPMMMLIKTPRWRSSSSILTMSSLPLVSTPRRLFSIPSRPFDGSFQTTLRSWSREETEIAGSSLAKSLGPKRGDLILLYGSVGAGKSVFARGFIREAMGDPDLRVQSPTFLLEQEYEMPSSSKNNNESTIVIHHFDLYRFDPEMTEIDARALDWRESVTKGVCLVEWPERIKRSSLLPPRWISVKIDFSDDDERLIVIESHQGPLSENG